MLEPQVANVDVERTAAPGMALRSNALQARARPPLRIVQPPAMRIAWQQRLDELLTNDRRRHDRSDLSRRMYSCTPAFAAADNIAANA